MAKLCLNDSEMLRGPQPKGRQVAGAGQPQWYAVHAYLRSESQVACQLTDKGFEAFLPSYREVRKWSDRTKAFVKPLIPGYVFVRVVLTGQTKLRALETFGVRSFVAFAGVSPTIPNEQIEHLKKLSENNISGYSCSGSIQAGQRVRVRNGCLAGLEGVVLMTRNCKTLAVSIDSINHSVSILADEFDLELL